MSAWNRSRYRIRYQAAENTAHWPAVWNLWRREGGFWHWVCHRLTHAEAITAMDRDAAAGD